MRINSGSLTTFVAITAPVLVSKLATDRRPGLVLEVDVGELLLGVSRLPRALLRREWAREMQLQSA